MGVDNEALCKGSPGEDEFSFIICPICCDIFRGPILQCTWGHSFCAECIMQWLSKKPNCPECRKPMQNNNLCRNLLTEQAIDELALKNFIKKPLLSGKLFRLPELGIQASHTPSRKMILQMIGCNFLFVVLCFIALAVFFEDYIRSEMSQTKGASLAEVLRTKMENLTETSGATDDHMPLGVIVKEISYYISTGATVTFSFVIRKVLVATKVCFSLALWTIVKAFIGFSVILEYTGFGVKWVVLSVSTISLDFLHAVTLYIGV